MVIFVANKTSDLIICRHRSKNILIFLLLLSFLVRCNQALSMLLLLNEPLWSQSGQAADGRVCYWQIRCANWCHLVADAYRRTSHPFLSLLNTGTILKQCLRGNTPRKWINPIICSYLIFQVLLSLKTVRQADINQWNMGI